MSGLVIDLKRMDTGEADGGVQKIDVGHLAAREIRAAGQRRTLGVSPGVLLVLPIDAPARFLVDAATWNVPQGLVLVLGGETEKALVSAGTVEDAEETPRALRAIELSVRVNDAFALRDLLNLPVVLDPESSDAVGLLFEQAVAGDEPLLLPPRFEDISRCLLAARLVSVLLRAAGKLPGQHDARVRDERLLRLRQFLVANLGNRITTSAMAAHMHMSRSAFNAWAGQRLPCTPARYLKRLRLQQCQEWIAQGRRDFPELADQAGFSDRSHLDRAFKRHFGLTPAQYGRMCQTAPRFDGLARAAEHFEHHRFDEALSVCDEALQGAPSPGVRDRIRYQRGLCLQALGRSAEAMAEWTALQDSTCAQQAGMQRCRQLFHAGEWGQALEELRRLCGTADDSEKRRLAHLWIDQVLVLRARRRPRPLRRYLAARVELFPRDPHSLQVAADILSAMGEEEEICRSFRALPAKCFYAMRRAGKFRQAIARFASAVPAGQVAITLFLFGRYEEALAAGLDQPLWRAEALTALGRPEEAIRRYPEHSACAYLALRRYRELIERFPPEHLERVHALHALKRYGPLRGYPRHNMTAWHEAQLYACPEAILDADDPDTPLWIPRALLLKGLDALCTGDLAGADAMLGRIHGICSPDLWWRDHGSVELLLVSVIRGLRGDRKHLRADLDEIAARHKLKNKQTLWYDAGFLLGTITPVAYRRQPQRQELAARLTFIQAIAHDVGGRREPARQAYRQFLEDTRPYPADNLLRHRFAQWRLRER